MEFVKVIYTQCQKEERESKGDGVISTNNSSNSKRNSKNNSRPRKRYGDAPLITRFRSHERRLSDGEYYRKSNNQRYYGSVCDECEKKGRSHFHHPLRCDRRFKDWRAPGKAPELNGCTTWYVRGGRVAELGVDVPECRFTCTGRSKRCAHNTTPTPAEGYSRSGVERGEM